MTRPINAEQATLCHDLRQFVSAGRLLVDAPSTGLVDAGERLSMLSELLSSMEEMLTLALGDEQRSRRFDLTSLITDCVALVRLTSRVPHLWVRPEPKLVLGNSTLIKRALLNLLTNAAHAAGPDGLVTVRLRVDRLDYLVEVVDTGEGFGRSGSISGHGMSVVDAALRAVHGKLEIMSDPGAGTAVRMRIPMRGELR